MAHIYTAMLIVLVQPADGVVVDDPQVHLVAAELADVVEAVLDHRRPERYKCI